MVRRRRRTCASFGAHLFLSANPESVARALHDGVAAATILPSKAPQTASDQLRIAFDGDAVIFGDESERVSEEQGIDAFHRNEIELADQPLSGGPFRGFLAALHRLQAAFPADASPIRTALVTARSAPAHKRVILTLRSWGVRLDEALFLGGRDKGPFLEAFGADIFFDDSHANVESARKHVDRACAARRAQSQEAMARMQADCGSTCLPRPGGAGHPSSSTGRVQLRIPALRPDRTNCHRIVTSIEHGSPVS